MELVGFAMEYGILRYYSKLEPAQLKKMGDFYEGMGKKTYTDANVYDHYDCGCGCHLYPKGFFRDCLLFMGNFTGWGIVCQQIE